MADKLRKRDRLMVNRSNHRNENSGSSPVNASTPPKRGLKPVRSINPIDALADINPSRPPRGIPTVRWNEGMPRGRRENKSLAWHRGHHAGIYDAALTIKQRYPRIATELLKAFGMDAEGVIR